MPHYRTWWIRAKKPLFQLLVLFLPTQLGYHFWPSWAFIFGQRIDYFSPTVYLTDILLFVLMVGWAINFKGKSAPVFGKSWIVVAAFCVLNILLAIIPILAFIKWLKLFEVSLLAFFVSKDKDFEVTSWFIAPLVFSSVFFSLVGILQTVMGGTLGGIFYYFGERSFTVNTPGIALGKIFNTIFLRPYATFSHPNSMAGFLGVILLLGFYIFQKYRLGLVVVIMAFFLTLSRTAFLAIFLATLPLIFNQVKKVFLKAVITGGLFLTTLIFTFSSVNIPKNINLPLSVSERIILTKASFAIFLQHPLWGVGLGNFIAKLPETVMEGSRVWLLQPVHNIALLVLTEGGIVGLVLSAIAIFLFFKNIKLGKSPQHLRLTSVLVFIFITALFDHYWITLQQNILLVSIVLGLSLRNDLSLKNG